MTANRGLLKFLTIGLLLIPLTLLYIGWIAEPVGTRLPKRQEIEELGYDVPEGRRLPVYAPAIEAIHLLFAPALWVTVAVVAVLVFSTSRDRR